jgi:sarcosine oxidase subunit alpha
MDFSAASFPHLAVREGRLLGHAARVYRVSYTVELAYEINVPAGSGQHLWIELLKAGHAYGVQPFGIEALLLLRLEKGFLHVGTDTDGTTLPDDVGWGRVASNKQHDFSYRGRQPFASAGFERANRRLGHVCRENHIYRRADRLGDVASWTTEHWQVRHSA